MTEVYRLVKSDRLDDVLSGEGARLYGGRWNPPGIAVVYASESRALAVLEMFVHLTVEARAMHFVLCTIALPSRARVRRHDEKPRSQALAASQRVGAGLIEGGRALALAMPSVIVPQERNYVLNVRHPQFAQVRISATERFSFDERLWRPRG